MIRFREQASLYRTILDQAVLAALQGCHFIITISGLSVALQLLVTLSPSQRLAPEVGTRSLTLELPSHWRSRSSTLETATRTRSLTLELPATGDHVRRLSRSPAPIHVR